MRAPITFAAGTSAGTRARDEAGEGLLERPTLAASVGTGASRIAADRPGHTKTLAPKLAEGSASPAAASSIHRVALVTEQRDAEPTFARGLENKQTGMRLGPECRHREAGSTHPFGTDPRPG